MDFFPTRIFRKDFNKITKKFDAVRRCPDRGFECNRIAKEKLKHFVSKEAFNIDGLGKKVIDQFWELNLVKNPSDIFDLNFEKIKIPSKPVPIVMVLAGVSTPLILNFHFLSFTSFPAHDYLINHLILFSVIMCLVFPKDALKLVLKNFNLAITVPLFIFYTLIFGSVLDKYVSSFYPTGFRIPLFFLPLHQTQQLQVIS